ncbi:acyltransferase family protein [Yersinia kristensenii]|uniref:acyltransferase family protein n=1 Tax=Yersinia kristensenii TaxID=28152 RepID=UPI000C147F89|nr:acyltransferase [Yersinia kristensenii]MDA5520848.1 acyltransferase [Yersinia kristensenii]PHZ33909.1 hypothetical protein CS536_21165 [Yersinia kristensenii]
MNNKLGSVEGIRGIACLMVFLSHLSSTFAPSMHTGNISNARTPIDIWLHSSPFAFIYSGAAAVGIFFVLSGFILSHVILEKNNIAQNSTGMVIKRYFRLMPPALLSCILAFMIFKFIPVDNSALGDWARNYGIKTPSIIDAIYSGTIGAFFSGRAGYNWSLWTMKIEFFGSMVVFLLCFILPNVKYKKSLVIITMVIPFFMEIKKSDEIYYASFLSGVIIYLLNIKLDRKTALTLLFIGLFLCGYHSNGLFYQWIDRNVSLSVYNRPIDNYILFNNIGGFIFVFSILKSDILSKIFANKKLNTMGALSFSVYILHQPIMYVTCPYIFNFSYSTGASYSVSALVASLFTLLIVYALSIPYYKYVDNSSVKISNRVKTMMLNHKIEK